MPAPAAPELARLARAYNGMADRLAQAVDENVRLESDQEVARCLQSRLEAERRSIARDVYLALQNLYQPVILNPLATAPQ